MAEFFLHKGSPTYLHPENAADVLSISQFMAQNLRQPPPPIPPPPKHTFEISEGESVEIEKIVAAEKKDGQLFYKVKWVKYTWEAEESIQHLPHLIDGYWREHFYQNINQAAIDTTGISLVSNETDYARNKSVVVAHDNRDVQKHVTVGNAVASAADNQGINGTSSITATATVGENNDVMLEFTMGGQPGKGIEYQNRVVATSDKKPRRSYPLERKYVCQVCAKAFDRNTSLTRHMLVHTREKPFKCQLCDKAFSQNAHLKRHLLIHIGQKSYQCNKCGKMFIEKGGLARHEATHSTEKPWVCNQCGKAFVLNEYLQRHLFLHTGQKPYQCNECGRLFADGSSWRAHKLTHNKEKKFKCHICSKMLKCKRNFKKHVQAHADEKEMKHQCDVCLERFPNKKALKDHVRKSKKHHRCKVCRKLLKTREKYETHMATHDPASETYNPEIKEPDPNDPDEKDDDEDEDDGQKSDGEGSTKSDVDIKSDEKNVNDEDEEEEEEEEEEEKDDDDDEEVVTREEGEVLLDKILEQPDQEDKETQVTTPTSSNFTALILKPEHVNQMVAEASAAETTISPEENPNMEQVVMAARELGRQVPGVLELNTSNRSISVPMNTVTPTIDVVGTPQDENMMNMSHVVMSTDVSHVALQPNIILPNSSDQCTGNDLGVSSVSSAENGVNVQESLDSMANSTSTTMLTANGTSEADVAETIILITQNNDVDMTEQM